MDDPAERDRPSRRSVAELSDLKSVNVPVMVYVAIVVGILHRPLSYNLHGNRPGTH